MVEISVLGRGSDDLRSYWDVEQAAQRADRRLPFLRSLRQLEQQVHRPGPYYERTLLTAVDGDELVGVAEVGWPLGSNEHMAELEVDVLSQHRRRGIGKALHDEAVRRARGAGRTTVSGEAHRDGDQPSPSAAFAEAMGFEVGHREEHHVLELPVPPTMLSGLLGLPGLATSVPGYEIVTWRDRAPDDLVEGYARMRTQLGADIPRGDLDSRPVPVDVAKVRAEEERTSESYQHVVAVARSTSDGELGGYTLVFLPRDSDEVLQDDTLVMPAHRGHGLGMALKATVLRLLAASHPERRRIHTWNGVDNAPMQAINRELGFAPVELLLEVQRRIGRA